MKVAALALALLLAAAAPGLSTAVEANPVAKVIQLVADLETKIIKEGETAQKLYAEYSEWCEDRARDLSHNIKTATAEIETLQAKIASETAAKTSINALIEELTGSIATDEADLKAATQIRESEAKDFAAEDAELSDSVSMLERAIGILEREMAKGGAAMVQIKAAKSLAQALSVMVDASAMSSADARRLTALVQSTSSADDTEDDSELGAPAAAIYEGHSGDIIETLQGLLDKAGTQLDGARKKETANLHNFEMLKQSLEDEIKFANKDFAEAKKNLAGSAQVKAAAEGDLAMTSKDLKADKDSKADLHVSCMTKAEDFEAETKSRGEELKALAEAKKVIKEATGGAADISYELNQVSFVQEAAISRISSSMDLANFEAVRLVRDLARKVNAPELVQLARRMAMAARQATGNADPFGKVKGLIADMIEKLESEAAADASKKAYCDKELSETNEKKADKSAEISKLTTKIDQMSAKSATLKSEVAELQDSLAKLYASQASMDKIRGDEHSAFVSNKADMEQGLAGVKMALKILNEYYAKDAAHETAKGAGSSIIGLLEVVESDFSKELAGIVTQEESSAVAYDRETKENEIEKTTKTQDVAYKTKESSALDKESAEYSGDRSGVQAELDAILEYLAKLQQECTEVAGTYADTKARREKEIVGLKDALKVLESETALLQRQTSRRHRLAARGSGGFLATAKA